MLHDQFQKDLFAKASPAQWSWEPWVCDPRDSFAKDEIFDSPIPGPFFLTVGVARVHKNQSKIIQAFKEFRLKYPEFYLVIKAIVEDHEYDDYRKELAEDDHIIVIPGPYSTKAMDLLYMTCAAYISASMCEGLDMPAIKAVKCNKPVLIARHTGHEDWVPEGLRTLATKTVDMSEMPNIHPRYREKGMMGFDTTVDSILCGMRDMVKSPELFLMSLGERFTYEACKKSMEKNIDILKKL